MHPLMPSNEELNVSAFLFDGPSASPQKSREIRSDAGIAG